MHDGLHAGCRVKFRVSSHLLLLSDVQSFPVEQDSVTEIDEEVEKLRVYSLLPDHSRGQDDVASEEQVHQSRRGLGESVHDSVVQTLWSHGWGDGDEMGHFLVQVLADT